MSVRVELLSVAEIEYNEAVDWYESQSSGLGRRFLASVREVLEEIGEQPDRYPETEPRVREAPVSGWPYAIYYQTYADRVNVISVFHCSRDPAIWQWRAEQSKG